MRFLLFLILSSCGQPADFIFEQSDRYNKAYLKLSTEVKKKQHDLGQATKKPLRQLKERLDEFNSIIFQHKNIEIIVPIDFEGVIEVDLEDVRKGVEWIESLDGDFIIPLSRFIEASELGF